MTTQPPSARPSLLGSVLGSKSLTGIATTALVVALAGAGVAIGRSASSSDDSAAPVTTPSSPVTPTAPESTPTPSTGSPTPKTSTSQSAAGPAAALAKAFRLALAQHTVHCVARNVSTKFGTTVFDDYDGKTVGKQHITANGGYVDIRVIGETTYLNGDTKGLAVYGFSPQQVTVLHGKWLSVVAGQAGYDSLTEGVTLASTLHGDRLAGPLKREADKTLNGVEVFGISGRAIGGGAPPHGAGTLWISKATGLPVEFDASNANTQITATFDDWGMPIDVPVPTDVFGHPGVST